MVHTLKLMLVIFLVSSNFTFHQEKIQVVPNTHAITPLK